DREAAEKAADLERNLRASGQTIGTRDVFIAGICLVRNLPLVTGNVEHFRRIPDLQVIPLGHWQEDVP
ncbi:MAG: type II toxin-antitoxin system VapC family toxin, partial [Bacillota bacterium]